MIMVRPCRLITRQRSHIGFTDGRTFKPNSFMQTAPSSAVTSNADIAAHGRAASRKW
jgi:hypothetical protein